MTSSSNTGLVEYIHTHLLAGLAQNWTNSLTQWYKALDASQLLPQRSLEKDTCIDKAARTSSWQDYSLPYLLSGGAGPEFETTQNTLLNTFSVSTKREIQKKRKTFNHFEHNLEALNTRMYKNTACTVKQTHSLVYWWQTGRNKELLSKQAEVVFFHSCRRIYWSLYKREANPITLLILYSNHYTCSLTRQICRAVAQSPSSNNSYTIGSSHTSTHQHIK